MRHGESQWNLENRFTGWTDVGLTKRGTKEAENAGILLNKEPLDFDLIYTSVLKRAVQTTELCLDAMGIEKIPIEYDWRLNERHYGALQGLNKSETAKKYGENQVLLWRRSYKTSPPLLELKDERHPKFDLKYQDLQTNALPKGESLKDTFNRVMPFWDNVIVPKILFLGLAPKCGRNKYCMPYPKRDTLLNHQNYEVFLLHLYLPAYSISF